MSTFIVYIRFRGHIERKYESAVNECEAVAQAMRYFKNSAPVKVVRLN